MQASESHAAICVHQVICHFAVCFFLSFSFLFWGHYLTITLFITLLITNLIILWRSCFFFSEWIVAQGLLCDCQAKTKSTAVKLWIKNPQKKEEEEEEDIKSGW